MSIILLADIGNTHTHLGLACQSRITRLRHIPTACWFQGRGAETLRLYLGPTQPDVAACCSVVPRATPIMKRTMRDGWGLDTFVLTHRTVSGIGIDYPRPQTIGPDRLANAIAVRHGHGAPALAVDFGTAVTFDIVNRQGNYAGGIIAPGLAAMTGYLHEKTALLPAVRIREIETCIGKNTVEAMLIGAVHGYRGMVRELIHELKRELGVRRLPVVATGGYAELIAAKLPEIGLVEQKLTLQGLLLAACNPIPTNS